MLCTADMILLLDSSLATLSLRSRSWKNSSMDESRLLNTRMVLSKCSVMFLAVSCFSRSTFPAISEKKKMASLIILLRWFSMSFSTCFVFLKMSLLRLETSTSKDRLRDPRSEPVLSLGDSFSWWILWPLCSENRGQSAHRYCMQVLQNMVSSLRWCLHWVPETSIWLFLLKLPEGLDSSRASLGREGFPKMALRTLG